MTDFIIRFAPSPTGPLHLGHAYSALLAHDVARANDGNFFLRIEDIDSTRARAHWEEQIYEDLNWLGITWDAEPIRQSDRLPAYQTALDTLWKRGLIYPCTCSRKDILAAGSAPQEGAPPTFGPDGLIYPGTCRRKPRPDVRPEGTALRLDISRAVDLLTQAGESRLHFTETAARDLNTQVPLQDMITNVGDIVLSRRDFLGSYHLAVVLDDAAQGITHVIRGEDIAPATQIHVLLQKLLNLPTPTYCHHGLIRDEAGKRLAKRDDARAIAKYREDGATPLDIRKMVGL